jgi:hypothetical protein
MRPEFIENSSSRLNSAILQFSYSHTSVSHNDTHLLAAWLITPSFVISESGTHPSPIACVEISFQSVLRQFSKSDDAKVFANFSSILNIRECDLVSKVCEQYSSNGGRENEGRCVLKLKRCVKRWSSYLVRTRQRKRDGGDRMVFGKALIQEGEFNECRSSRSGRVLIVLY